MEDSTGAGLVLKAIDHTHAFTCGRELTRRISNLDEVRDSTVFGRFPEFESFLDPEHVRAAAPAWGRWTVGLLTAFWRVFRWSGESTRL